MSAYDGEIKICVITKNRSVYGLKLLNKLLRDNVVVELIVVIKNSFLKEWRLFLKVGKEVGFTDTVFFAIERKMVEFKEFSNKQWENAPLIRDYSKLAKNVIFADSANSSFTEDILKKNRVDLILLGQSGIVKKNIIEIPKIGVLNAHPGYLPFYRGIDIPWWTIYNNDFDNLGISVHFVNEYIDAGDIIHRERINIAGDFDFFKLEQILYERCIDSLSETVSKIARGAHFKVIKQNLSEGTLYRKMSVSKRRVAYINYIKFINSSQ